MNGRELAELAAADRVRLLGMAAYYARGHQDVAEDAVQATVLRLLVVEADVEQPWSYMLKAVKNAVLDTLRRRRFEVSLGEWDGAAPRQDVERVACYRETIDEVRQLGTRCEKRDMQRLIDGEYEGSVRERVNLSRLRAKARAAGLASA